MHLEPYTKVVLDGEQIPEFLRQQQRWLTWKLTTNPQGKPTKKPDQSTTNGRAARTFQAVANVPRNAEGGIGFITTGKIPVPLTDGRRARLLLVDADACRDPRTGVLSPWAVTMLELLAHPYTEVSPSGTGLRAIVAVLDLPEHLKATAMLTGEQPPPGVNKKPQIQLFGLGPAGYVALTGCRLERCSIGLTVEPDVDAFLNCFNLIGEAPSKTGVTGVEQVVGLGNVPTESEIAARVAEMPNGRELLAANWQAVMPEKSASEAFYRFVTMVLTATNGHGEAALDFVLASMWGTGQVDDSRDPSKYGRRSWVAKEIVRAAAKQGTPKTNTDVFDVLPEQPPAPAAKRDPGKGDPKRVTEFLRADGPLVRLPTGLPTLDALTGGGLVLGSRVYLVGAPDAGKTALAVQIADVYLRMGIPVGILGIDEEPIDLTTRFMQRRGVAREEIEQRAPATIDTMDRHLDAMPLRLFDSDTSIEEAAVALHQFAQHNTGVQDRPPCVLVIDSVQAARCNDEKEDSSDSLYKAVTQRVRAIRAAASRYRMLVIATSEMNRGAYRSRKADEQTADMASAKESGAIEFSARVLLSLKSVQGDSEHVELRVVKNKHGLSHRNDQEGMFLRVDRAGQQLTEDGEFEPVDVEEQREEQKEEMIAGDAARLVVALMAEDMGRNAALRALQPQVPERRFNSARSWLLEVGAVTEVPGPNRSKLMRLDMAKVPTEVKVFVQRLLTGGS